MSARPQNSITLDKDSYHFGDTVTFTYEARDNVMHPGVYFYAYQNDQLVLATGGYPIDFFFPNNSFTIGATSKYQGGAAQGKAQLVDQAITHGKTQMLDEVEFDILA